MNNKTTTETREEILKMLMELAEEPEDIANGEGTFTTFRVEYVINGIMQLIQEQIEYLEIEHQKDMILTVQEEKQELLERVEKEVIGEEYVESDLARTVDKMWQKAEKYPNRDITGWIILLVYKYHIAQQRKKLGQRRRKKGKNEDYKT